MWVGNGWGLPSSSPALPAPIHTHSPQHTDPDQTSLISASPHTPPHTNTPHRLPTDYSKREDMKWVPDCWWDRDVIVYGDAGLKKDHPVVAFLVADK